jgi:hypothetical protein
MGQKKRKKIVCKIPYDAERHVYQIYTKLGQPYRTTRQTRLISEQANRMEKKIALIQECSSR